MSEILEKADKIEDRDARIHYLRNNATKPIQLVLRYALDPNIEWLISPEFPPYKPTIVEGRETMLLAEARRLYLFVKGGNDALTDAKRNVLLTQLLDMLDDRDIDLLKHAVQKKLPYRNLDYTLIKDAFPTLLPEEDTSTHITPVAECSIIEEKQEEEIQMAPIKKAAKKPAAKKAPAKKAAKKAPAKKKAAKKA